MEFKSGPDEETLSVCSEQAKKPCFSGCEISMGFTKHS